MKKLYPVFLAVLIVSAGAVVGQEKTQQERIDALEKQLLELQQQGNKPDFLNQAVAEGLTFNFYGEMKWVNKKGTDYLDPHRFVLIPSYKLSDYAIFTSEIEVEHGGVQDTAGGDGRFAGELEIEQFYIDAQINDWATWRSLGISLIPVGTVNQHHEPDQFYSVHRPVMYKYVIPSTWMEAGTGLHGDVPSVDGLSYFAYLSEGLSSARATHTDGNWAPRDTRPRLNEKSGSDSLAYSLKLAYAQGGFAGSVSTYQSNYSSANGKTDLGLYDVEASYNFTEGSLKGVELIADYAWWDIDDPSKIVGTGATKTGDKVDGYRLEIAYHMLHGDNELVPFIRSEGYSTQSGSAGSHNNYLTYGAMYKFGDHWEIKVGARQSLDSHSNTEYHAGVGMQF